MAQHTFRKKGDGAAPQQRRRRSPRARQSEEQVDLEALPHLSYDHFDQMTAAALAKEAKKAKVDIKERSKHEVIEDLLIHFNAEHEPIYRTGIVELMNDGYGFLRRESYRPSPEDIYIGSATARKFGLRSGDRVFALCRQAKEGDKYAPMVRPETVNGYGPAVRAVATPVEFDKLTPDFPHEKLVMETEADNIIGRVIDLISPIGKGSRGLVVAPPKAGKTTVMKTIAQSITRNNPEVKLMVLLVDERPEEVTDMKRHVQGQVISSTFDEPADNHMRVAELCLEQAKRMVELGQDVVILLDSITRLSRASNLTINPSGRTLSGGLDPAALYRPRRFFGAARNIPDGGSLTIIATVLIETGSKMDEAIFEELKGTGNMEIVLDRELAERRIWPAIDVRSSGTRHEEKLFEPGVLDAVVQLHRMLANSKDTMDAAESFIKLLKKTPNNAAFLEQIIARTRAAV
jgi:transcription termination factor Rho